MGKDPAFLFYSSDFLTGTMLMSDMQVGRFVRLLCLQHQKGHLKKKDMLKVCGGYDEDIFSKFAQDKEGLYYNMRLESEIEKRFNFSESRRKNRQKKDMNNTSRSHDEHMENEIENVNANESIGDKRGTGGEKGSPKGHGAFVPPTVEEVKAYCEERKNGIDAEAFVAHYGSKGWKVGNNPMADWKASVITWERRRAEQVRASPEVPERYRF